MKGRKSYNSDHKRLFLALFQGTTDVDAKGKIVVGDKEWDWTDVDVQYLARRVRNLKKVIEKDIQDELTYLFGDRKK